MNMRETKPSVERLKSFLNYQRPAEPGPLTAVSLFSGAGLSDIGYELEGFRFHVQVELSPQRAYLGKDNFPNSEWIVGDVRKVADKVVAAYEKATSKRLDLLVVTPPCQGMSSSNPGRGKRKDGRVKSQEDKNRLLLDMLPVVNALNPRMIVAENVRQVLTLSVSHKGRRRNMMEVLRQSLPDYEVFQGIVNVADYGVPQRRVRAIVVAIHRDEPLLDYLKENNLLPWPRPTHAETPSDDRAPWVSVREWFEAMGYKPLDAKAPETARGAHELHFVPHYPEDRYLLVSHIPPYSGRNAYENETCPSCRFSPIPIDEVACSKCSAIMKNRPWVLDKDKGTPRLIRGFKSSYRRMDPDRPASTVTTNSSHLGSDFKVHPWENRVLSILECADLQTVPRFYDWKRAFDTGRTYTIRTVVGEAFPPYFTYLHGQLIGALLSGEEVPVGRLAVASHEREEALVRKLALA